jgi:bifunctional NMN adenylyltransferase/nudix hydrolase
LPDGELPKVKGSDDAEKAKFIPLNDIDRSKCFEDHYEIISYFTGI